MRHGSAQGGFRACGAGVAALVSLAESRFSDLQMIPRDGKPVSAWTAADDALVVVAQEIRTLVANLPPTAATDAGRPLQQQRLDSSLDLVRAQVTAYARYSERTRQRMRPRPSAQVAWRPFSVA